MFLSEGSCLQVEPSLLWLLASSFPRTGAAGPGPLPRHPQVAFLVLLSQLAV